jgi:hypothetical protein
MTKNRHSRREFLSLSGVGIAAIAGGTLLGAAGTVDAQTTNSNPRNADLVVVNAKVYTVDERAPKAEAFAVKGGRFIAIIMRAATSCSTTSS